MSVWSKLVAYLSGWPESKEERIKTYAEEREEQKKAEVSALSTAKYLWNFLSGIAEKHNIPRQVAA